LVPLIEWLPGGISFVTLPSLPFLVVFNVADALGARRILSRLLFFSAGVAFIFPLSVSAVKAFPGFFILDASYLDIIWALFIVWLGYAVFRKREAFVIRAARENFAAWCFGTFMMGALFGALWINYLSTHDLTVERIYEQILTTTSVYVTALDSAVYAVGLCLGIVALSLAVYFLAHFARSFLQRHRMEVKMVCGSVFALQAGYFIFNDVWKLLLAAGLVI
jgi:cytochrome c biogenesis protein CcdA